LAGERSAWIILAMVSLLTVLHYVRPPIVLFPGGVLERHGVERIILLLPIAGATFAFGQAGGLITLGLAILIMLPRVFWFSKFPGDALVEVLAVGFVGYLLIWIITTQDREKRLRQAVYAVEDDQRGRRRWRANLWNWANPDNARQDPGSERGGVGFIYLMEGWPG
jgi:hypothetical protein